MSGSNVSPFEMALNKRKICVYTSTRAEYGLLRGLLQGIKTEPTLQLQILASGMHLSPEFGMTISEIRADGYEPDETVEILLSSDTPTAICKSMGLAMISYGEAIERLHPDMMLLLGDRFETFCMAAVAHVFRIPVAHIHGGETTEGAIDEAFRHSITKMSHLHFASCEAYLHRIIQLGEAPDRVFNVGALGVENIYRMSLMKRSKLAEAIGFNLEKPYFLVTFHPNTLEKETTEGRFQSLLDALDAFPEYNIILTKANSDTEGRVINRLIDEYAENRHERCFAVTSLGTNKYLSAMKYANAVIGNSSSGIIEAPSFKCPVVNIGDRQRGRIKAENVIDVTLCSQRNIEEALRKAISIEFLDSLRGLINPYDMGNTSSRILKIISKIPLSNIMKKTFHNIL